MPEVPKVDTCCFFFSTEVGSKIIGWWFLISGIIETIGSIFLLVKALGSKHQGSPVQHIFNTIFSIFIVLLGLYLLHGVYRRIMRYVRTWLTAATIYLIIITIGTIILLIEGSGIVLAQIINILLSLYFIIVVYSYYRDNLNTAPATY